MQVRDAHPTIDRLFEGWREGLGRDLTAYRNHVYRVFNLATWLVADPDVEAVETLAVAAAFHDIGIWLDDTLDYLEPSVERAARHLESAGRPEWTDRVGEIIRWHHKVRPWRGPGAELVEPFRRADWIDVSLFTLPTRVPRDALRGLLHAFPRAGFHARLVVLGIAWSRRHPLRPLPMFRW